MKKILPVLLPALLLLSTALKAQDMMNMFGDDKSQTDYTTATFKTTKLLTGQSIENPANGVLQFMISHRFGTMDKGVYNFFGLDQSAEIRFELAYGIGDRLSVGVGRSNFEGTYDGFMKYKIWRQHTGVKSMPVTVSYFGSIAVNSLKWQYPDRKNYFTSRLSYVHQLLIARKFNRHLSLQLTPTLVHVNIIPDITYTNDSYAIGAGGRYKITNRTSVNGEYFYLLPGKTRDMNSDCVSLGFDIETGGHVFQLMVTNSQHQFERGFITQTRNPWNLKNLCFGFNLSRVFTIKKPKSMKE
jgi:hypothetical protein